VFQPALKQEVPESRSNPNVQIFPSENPRSYALQKDGVFGTVDCLIMPQDEYRVVAPSVTQIKQGGGRTQNLMITPKIIRKSHLNSKFNLKIITAELKIFSHFVEFRLDLKIVCFYISSGSVRCLTKE
jgi:hypothetical protein